MAEIIRFLDEEKDGLYSREILGLTIFGIVNIDEAMCAELLELHQ